MEPIDPRIKLSALWLFVLLNIIFRDLHQFAMKPFLEMLLTGTYHGTEITEELMLIGGVLAEVPIAMVPLSLVMTHGVGRFVTSFAALIAAATLVSSAPMDLDDTLHLIMELLAIAAIVWTVWRWPGAPMRPFR